MSVFNEATARPYGYLVIDAKQNTPEKDRFKTKIIQPKYVIAPSGFQQE